MLHSETVFLRLRRGLSHAATALLFGTCLMAMPALAVQDQIAQAPGLRCGTDYGWCWATVPGRPGEPCFCPGPNGTQIPGRLF